MKDITSTAELAFTLMMSGIRNLIPSIEDVKKGRWDCEVFIGRQVSELKIGLIGFGRLGKAFSKYCLAFSGKLVIYDPFVKNFSVVKKSPAVISLCSDNCSVVNDEFRDRARHFE